jgi:hypothetical protein
VRETHALKATDFFGISHQDSGGLFRGTRRGDDFPQGRMDRVGSAFSDVDIETQVTGPDEQHIDPIDRGDLVDALDGLNRFDLSHQNGGHRRRAIRWI